MMTGETKIPREKAIPEEKISTVKELAEKIKSSKTILIASTKGLPGGQFHKIKKQLRGRADVVVAKKSLVIRAIDKVEKGAVKNLKKLVGADVCLMFSELDAFELSGILSDSQSSAKAKAGDIAPNDIVIEPGPTDLIPGPAISELGSVGLKVAVENGKLAIKNTTTIAKAGDEISDKAAGVMAKLGIAPMKVGFIPIGAYDGVSDKVYSDIKIDKAGTLEALRTAIGKTFGFAVNVGYVNEQTVKFFIAKAGLEAKALERLGGKAEGAGDGGLQKKKTDGNVKTETGGLGASEVSEGGEIKEETSENQNGNIETNTEVASEVSEAGETKEESIVTEETKNE